MFKLIVGCMGFIVNICALAIIATCAIFAAAYAGADADSATQWIYAGMGALAGFFVAAIVLGIPVLLLRMNQNLDELNSNLRKVRDRIDSSREVEHPIAEALFDVQQAEHSPAA